MSTNKMSRRGVLRAGAAGVLTATLGGMAGCTQFGLGGDTAVSQVPGDSQTVLVTNVEGILTDDATKQLANAYFETAADSDYYSGPENYEEALQLAEDESSLSPTDLQESVVFLNYDSMQGGSDGYGGAIFNAEWDEGDVVAALEESGDEFTQDEYNGKTVYRSDSEHSDAMLGILDVNRYVLGTTDAVEDVIDVDSGDADAIGEELRDAFDSAQDDSQIRFATEVPQDEIPREMPAGGGDSIQLDAYQEVPYVSGSLYSTGDTVGFEFILLAEDADAAEDVQEQTQALITMAESHEATTGEVETFLDNIEVTVDGSNVVIAYEEDVDTLADHIEATTETLYGQ